MGNILNKIVYNNSQKYIINYEEDDSSYNSNINYSYELDDSSYNSDIDYSYELDDNVESRHNNSLEFYSNEDNIILKYANETDQEWMFDNIVISKKCLKDNKKQECEHYIMINKNPSIDNKKNICNLFVNNFYTVPIHFL